MKFDTSKIDGRFIVDLILWSIGVTCLAVIVWASFTQEVFVYDKEEKKPEPKNITVIYITNNIQECKK